MCSVAGGATHSGVAVGTHTCFVLACFICSVRGTVRSLDSAKTREMPELAPGSASRLSLVQADLLNADSWPAAVAGVDFVMHVASPFPLTDPKDPETQLYRPAVEGTLNVLRAVAAANPRPRRVVLTR